MNITPPNLLQLNIYDEIFKNKFLIVGACIPRLYPNIFTQFKKKWGNVVSICLEQTHYNQINSKLVDIIGLGQVKSVGFLTADRSPHCVQLHYMSKYFKRNLKVDVDYKHYVVTEDHSVYEVGLDAINDSRNFAKIGKKV